MDDKKIAFIYGKEKYEKGILEGQVEKLGDIRDEIRHAVLLIDFAHEKYPEVSVFQKLNSRHIPEVISFFYGKCFNHIVFLNTTSFKRDGIISHGKKGTLILPDNISSTQLESLKHFLEEIDDYSINILYDLEIVDGLLDGKELTSVSHDSPTDLLDKYLKRREKPKTV